MASAAPDCSPNREIATATSKKFDVPIGPAVPASLCGGLGSVAPVQPSMEMPSACNTRGSAIAATTGGCTAHVTACRPSRRTTVATGPTIAPGSIRATTPTTALGERRCGACRVALPAIHFGTT